VGIAFVQAAALTKTLHTAFLFNNEIVLGMRDNTLTIIAPDITQRDTPSTHFITPPQVQ
jgi:hypothetical protein